MDAGESLAVQRDDATLARWRIAAHRDAVRLSALWFGGSMVLAVGAVHVLLQAFSGLVEPKLYDWAIYVALAMAWPLSLGLIRYSAYASTIPVWAIAAQVGLVALATVATLYVMTISSRWAAVPLMVVQTVGIVVLLRSALGIEVRDIVAVSAATLAGWVAALSLIWWEPLQTTILGHPAGLIVIAAVALGVSWWVMGPDLPALTLGGRGTAKNVAEIAADAAAVTIVVALSLRTDGLIFAFQPIGVLFHWGAFVGPALQVQEGGWLLWDVPAIYGPLFTWTLAALPLSSPWQSLYVLNALAMLLSAVAVYSVLRAIRPDVVGKLIALALTIPAVFLAATWPPDLQPTQYFPSFGPLRYLWCYLLIALIAVEARQTRGSRRQFLTLAAGMVCWLIGVLWSFETAIFCTVVWLPAYAWIVWRRQAQGDGWRSDFRRALPALAIPIALFVTLVAAVAALYLVRLGTLPDLRAYVEYVVSFGSGDVSQNYHVEQNVLNFTDAHLVIVVVLAIVGGAAASMLRSRPIPREIPLLLALWAGVWLISGYAVSRPHPHAVSRSWPIMLVAVGVSLLVVTRRLGWRPTLTMRAALVPLVTMLLISTYSNVPDLERNLRDMRGSATSPMDVAAGIPDAEPALQALLSRAAVTPADPFVYDGDIGGNPMPAWVAQDGQRIESSRSWLPNPLVELILVPEARRSVYMQRMSERRQSGGWYVQRNGGRVTLDGAWEATGPWLFAQLRQTHVPTRAIQNDEWQLIWFDDLGEYPDLGQPNLATGLIHPAPPQISIDGVPVNEGSFRGLWMIPGEGWAQDVRGRGLTLRLPAQASIFSGHDQQVTLTLQAVRKIDASSLELLLDGRAVGRFTSKDRQTASIDVLLQRGWNEVAVAGIGVGLAESLVAGGDVADRSGDRTLLLSRFDISLQEPVTTATGTAAAKQRARIAW